MFYPPTLPLLLTLLPVGIQAGFGSGPGTDPFGFGNVSELCLNPPFQTRNFVPNWWKLAPLHFVMMSKEHLTRLTQRMYGSLIVPDLNLKEDLKMGCFILQQSPLPVGMSHKVTGFGSKSIQLPVYPLGFPGLFRFDVLVPGDVGGISALSLSDNFSFNLGVICWDDGIGTWLVSSTKRRLSHDNRYLIHAHIAALGFNPDNLLSIDYSECTTINPNATHHHDQPKKIEYYNY